MLWKIFWDSVTLPNQANEAECTDQLMNPLLITQVAVNGAVPGKLVGIHVYPNRIYVTRPKAVPAINIKGLT